jgi:hypothetical protein
MERFTCHVYLELRNLQQIIRAKGTLVVDPSSFGKFEVLSVKAVS